LSFYVFDFTNTCQGQLCALRDSLGDLQAMGAKVFGISTDSHHSHRIFKEQNRLNYQLLSDWNRSVSKAYGGQYDRFGSVALEGVAKRVGFGLRRHGARRRKPASWDAKGPPGPDAAFAQVGKCWTRVRVRARRQSAAVRDRRGHTKARGPRLPFRPRCRRFLALFPGLPERGAPRGLHDREAGPRALAPAKVLQLVERLPHPDDAGPAAGREHDPLRQAVHGLPDFEEDRLLPFHAIGFAERRDVERFGGRRAVRRDPTGGRR